MTGRLRVIQWTTGKVGRLSLRAIIDDPRLDLVGVYAYSADKAGVDAGSLCGRPDTGVVTTNDLAELVALRADTVIYTPFMADLDHVIALLESGADVISTNMFLNVGGIQGEVAQRLEAACAKGNSSLHISGINPGWVNSITAALTAICRNVKSVTVAESADCSVYASPDTWNALGMGVAGVTQEVMEMARNWLIIFRDATERMAVALGHSLDENEFFCEFGTAARDIDLGWFRLPKGTNAALRGGWSGKVGGETVVASKITWYLTTELEQGWALDKDHYIIRIDAEPVVETRVHFEAPASWGDAPEWDIMTAMPPVNAAFAVKAARSGILTLRDAGLP